MLTTILLCISYFMTITWSLIMLLFLPFGLQLYKISESSKVCLALKRLPKRGTIIEDGNIRGWTWGFPYIGYIHPMLQSSSGSYNTVYEIYIVTTQQFYNSILHSCSIDETHDITNNKNKENNEGIEFYERMGNYWNFRFDMRKLHSIFFKPWKNQRLILKQIKSKYERGLNNHKQPHPNLSVIIWGKTGSGKSMIPVLISKYMKASLCDTFNPCDPNDNMIKLYNQVCPTKEKPLIIVLEEFDILIKKIHVGIEPHKHHPISVYNKTTWNTFLDRINNSFFPYIILIMTSNYNPSMVNDWDPSYIRSGRVNLIIKLESK